MTICACGEAKSPVSKPGANKQAPTEQSAFVCSISWVPVTQVNPMESPLIRWVTAGFAVPTSPALLLLESVAMPVRSASGVVRLTLKVEAAKAGAVA